ncbi:MAG: PilZ domain-containing protein, partial [Candidatus Omnitrophica bacterium]|nr:PilZ domain-containing protein [Candidatus Omnitrophota bacterium]
PTIISRVFIIAEIVTAMLFFAILTGVLRSRAKEKKEADKHTIDLEAKADSSEQQPRKSIVERSVLGEELENLKKEKAAISDELSKQTESFRVDKIRAERLKKENADLKEAEQNIKKELEQLKDENQRLKEKVTEQGAQREEIIPQAQTKVEEVKQKELEEELGKKNQKLEILEKENKEIVNKLEDAAKKVAEYKSKMEVLVKEEDNHQALSAEQQHFKKLNLELENELSSQDEQLQNLIKANTQLEKELKEKSERLKAKEAYFEKFKEEGEEKKQETVVKEVKPLVAAKIKRKQKLGEVLLAKGLISQENLDKALEYSKQYGRSITQYLIHYGHIEESELAECLCVQFGIPYIPLMSYDISQKIVDLVPVDLVERYWLVPVDRQGATLMVAMIDPLDQEAIKEVEKAVGLKVIPFVAITAEVMSALETYYKVSISVSKGEEKKNLPFFIDTKHYSGVDRRRAIRFKTEIEVRFPVQGEYKKSVTKDISRDGISFISEKVIPIGEVFPIEIDLPDGISEFPISAIIQVVRFIPLEDNKSEISARIMKVSKQELATIIEYASAHCALE